MKTTELTPEEVRFNKNQRSKARRRARKEQATQEAAVRQAEFDRLSPANKEARQTGRAVGKYIKKGDA